MMDSRGILVMNSHVVDNSHAMMAKIMVEGTLVDDVMVDLVVRTLVVRCLGVRVGLVVQIVVVFMLVVLVIAVVIAECVVALVRMEVTIEVIRIVSAVALLVVEVSMVRRMRDNNVAVVVRSAVNTVIRIDIMVIIVVIVVNVRILHSVVVVRRVASPVVVSLGPFMAVGFEVGWACVAMVRHRVGNVTTVRPLVGGVLRGDVVGSMTILLMMGWNVMTLVVALEMVGNWHVRDDCFVVDGDGHVVG